MTTIHAKCDTILFPQSHSAKFFWIGLSALTVLGTTRGNLLSGRAACFWNNDFDKSPTTTFFDSLTAKTLSLDRGHPTLQLSVSLKQRYRGNCWQFLAAQECQGKWKYDTPCETLLLSLHYCSVPGHFFWYIEDYLQRCIFCTLSGTWQRSNSTPARNIISSHAAAGRPAWGRMEIEVEYELQGTTPFKVHHQVRKNHSGASSVVFLFFLQLWIILPFVHCYQGLLFIVVTPGREEASITLGVMFCNILPREMWTRFEPKNAQMLRRAHFNTRISKY